MHRKIVKMKQYNKKKTENKQKNMTYKVVNLSPMSIEKIKYKRSKYIN